MIKQSHKIATPARQHSAPASLHAAPSESSTARSGSPREQASDPPERQAENTILVVNDEPELLELMCRLLRKSGYHVLTAVDGQEGFEVAQAEQPRLIISDVVMPRMDGIAMCRLIRAHPDLHLTPVLLAGLSDREYQVLCLIASGKSVGQIAAELSLSAKTISTYRARILEKMGMKTNAELTHYAISNKLVG